MTARTLMMACLCISTIGTTAAMAAREVTAGELRIISEQTEESAGVCPLKHTAVDARITGMIARVDVRQVFHNPTDQKIEAVYVFPLPQGAAVDDMTMTIGDRVVVGKIKERGEARAIYEAARQQGHVAGLLDQERPNIFTQSVANIEPGVEVVIEISYVETVKREEGRYEWVFPMVVGPRYVPGGGSAPEPMTSGQPTGEVPDGDKITPPVTPPNTRAGHDISLQVRIEGGDGMLRGLAIKDIESELHEIDVAADAIRPLATVSLRHQDEIPNRDFVLRYDLADDEIGDAFFVHEDERGRFFTLILQPPERVAPEELITRELVFVLDTSGSMRGQPIDKSKALMQRMIDSMRPDDTFNIITFAGHTKILWDEPRIASEDNIKVAKDFVEVLQGGGGTEMMKAINTALKSDRAAADDARIRVVCFMTDGYVGNDMAIIDAIKQNAATTRVFGFGIGNSVNRFLLDNMATAGRGEVEYVTLGSDADAAVWRFHERVLAPVLTDVEIDWGGLPVADVHPQQIPDLWSAKPILVHGRLTSNQAGTIVLRGNTGAGRFEEPIAITAYEDPPERVALPSLWARAKIADLMMENYAGLQHGSFPKELKQQIIDLGIEYRLMTQFTSFVAVEETTVTVGGEPVRVDVPVEMPEGVSYEGVFGKGEFKWSRGTRVGGMFGRGRPAVTAAPAAKALPETLTYRYSPRDREDSPSEVSLSPPGSLVSPLDTLAERVAKDGQEGTLTTDGVKVRSWRVNVMIFLGDLSDETRAAMQKFGVEIATEKTNVRVIIGSIDVRKLHDLAKLDAVVQVRPIVHRPS